MEASYYGISRTELNGDSGFIKVEYFNPDEYKITILQNNQVLDSFTVVGRNDAVTKIMFYQNKLFSKIVETVDMVYDQILLLKQVK